MKGSGTWYYRTCFLGGEGQEKKGEKGGDNKKSSGKGGEDKTSSGRGKKQGRGRKRRIASTSGSGV